MKYKGILLDIDNTLYNYNTAHAIAKANMLDFCVRKFNIPKDEVSSAFEVARKNVHIQLKDTAASHNRLLYFQNMSEILGVNPMTNGLDIYDMYWDSFLEVMKPFDGIYSLFEKYKNKICLVTDLTAHIQYRKIKTLELDNYCDQLVTSEEVGIEKPSALMFSIALKKLKLEPKEVCMIGDNFKKDILGAVNMNIDAIWLNHEGKNESFQSHQIKEAKQFKEILKLV